MEDRDGNKYWVSPSRDFVIYGRIIPDIDGANQIYGLIIKTNRKRGAYEIGRKFKTRLETKAPGMPSWKQIDEKDLFQEENMLSLHG